MPKINGPFDGQIVLNFTEQSHAPVDSSWLEKRWNQYFPNKPNKKLNGYTYLHKINKHESVPNCDMWFKENDAIRIYVVIHTAVAAREIPISTSQSQPHLTVEKLAEVLKEIIGDQKNVVVNLIACSAARGEENNPDTAPEKSIASRLHEQLYLLTNRDIPVIARLTLTAITAMGKKLTRPIASNNNDPMKKQKRFLTVNLCI